MVILLDIDGTVLNSNHEIQNDTLHDIKVFSETNRIILMSARKPSSVRLISKQLGLKEKLIVCYNGALLLNGYEKISEHFLPSNQVSYIYKLAKKLNISINIYSYDSWYVDHTNSFIEKEAQIIAEQPILLTDKLENLLIHKVLLIGSENKLAYIKKYTSKINDLLITHSKNNYLEITHSKASKKNAFDFLKSYLLLNSDETLAIGDGHNDIDLLKEVSIGVAMGNSSEDVKKAADFITYSNNKNGVGYALRSLLKS
mgnify:CR=1 FL=1